MRRRLANVPPPVKAGALVFVMALALFSLTTYQLTGYEPETGAVTEGLVLEGSFADDESSPLPMKADVPGDDGRYYARTGLLQPLLEAPFFAAGHFVDVHFGPVFSDFPNGYAFLWFYNPFVAALAALSLFALVFLARGSIRWASTIAALFAFASIAWPYSKIGMETTFMAAIIAAFALALWARRSPSLLSWGLTGLATGAAAATKAYTVLAVVPIAILLLPTFLAMERRDKVRSLIAVCLPVLLWGGAIAAYNAARFGSPTDFGYPHTPMTLSAPLNVIGLLFSPGKGLVLYSPLVILGALGIPRMWKQDRTLVAALMSLFAIITVFSAATTYWGDEVWGPRYIAPVAWTLLVPIAWWAGTVTRQKVLAGFACLGIFVQLIGVSAQYGQYTAVVQAMSGVPIYQNRYGVDPEKIPYGDDPTRWIPELSALLVQTEGLISSQVFTRFGDHGLKVTYAPFEGRSRTVDLSDPRYVMPLDFWWVQPTNHVAIDRLFAALLALVTAAAGVGLYLVSFGRRLPWRVRAQAAAS